MNAELLARLQFAYTIMFHYIFPPFTIGIGFLLVIYESLYLATKNKIYESITRFWIKQGKIFPLEIILGRGVFSRFHTCGYPVRNRDRKCDHRIQDWVG